MTEPTQPGGTTPEPPAANRTRFVLVGAGVIGKQHGQVITELADRIELVAVVDPHADRAEKLAAEHGAATFASLTEALAAVETDAVSICTPTGTHGALAIEALRAGRHVIIEKPAEVTVAKTDEIIAAQREAGTLVTVISQHRFDRSTEIAVAAIERGELGRLTSGIAVHRLVAGAELLRLGRLARHLGAGRRWRPDEPGRTHRRPAGRHAGPAGRGLRLHRDPCPPADRGRGRHGRRGPVRERRAGGAARDYGRLPGSERAAAGARRQGLRSSSTTTS